MLGRTVLRGGLLLIGGLASAAGCALAVESDGSEQMGEAADAIQPRLCPEIAIMCVDGYRVKQLPNCNQICVPDEGFECSIDKDCGSIYCITTPCDQPVCRGHQCVIAANPPAHGPGNGQGGKPCGDSVCGGSMYCCNASCGICAPLDGVCIMMACLP
ncbi:MAG: hypothetical protein HY744_01605 [Deltaproteobacteria bacterium]|nr:hypothetical protein [Deltaproteobacteria bacterium]